MRPAAQVMHERIPAAWAVPTYTNGITNLYYRGPGGLMTCFTTDLVIFFLPLNNAHVMAKKRQDKDQGVGLSGLSGLTAPPLAPTTEWRTRSECSSPE
jgi:hypothetical protein